jgi:hypothetical protein
MNYHLTPTSTNSKLGLGVAASTSTAATCPDACPLKSKGCYAAGGPLNIHWRAITQGKRGTNWTGFVAAVASLPVGHKFRHNQAGDLPGENNDIDGSALAQLSGAVKARRLQAWSYTHKPLTSSNLASIKRAIADGLIVNGSADNPAEADEIADAGLPTVVVLPDDAPAVSYTPAGRKIVVCPAQQRDNASCASCMLCHKKDRSCIVGFRAHGMSKKHVSKIVSA